MTMGRPYSAKLWLVYAGTLEELASRLREAEIIGEAELDFENVYEWIEAPLRGSNIGLNLSREHSMDEAPLDVLLMIEEQAPSEALIDGLAQRLAVALGVEVMVGEIEYLGGDDYRRTMKRRFAPGD